MDVLEVLDQVLSHESVHGVLDHSGSPAGQQTANALFTKDLGETTAHAQVTSILLLHHRLDGVKGNHDRGVGHTDNDSGRDEVLGWDQLIRTQVEPTLDLVSRVLVQHEEGAPRENLPTKDSIETLKELIEESLTPVSLIEQEASVATPLVLSVTARHLIVFQSLHRSDGKAFERGDGDACGKLSRVLVRNGALVERREEEHHRVAVGILQCGAHRVRDEARVKPSEPFLRVDLAHDLKLIQRLGPGKIHLCLVFGLDEVEGVLEGEAAD